MIIFLFEAPKDSSGITDMECVICEVETEGSYIIWISGVPRNFVREGVQQIRLRTERTGIWWRQPPSQGFWRQLYCGTRNFISQSKLFLLFMMATNLFVIANVKQLRIDVSFRILPYFFRTSWGVGVLNSAIFNSFHNRVEFGTILEGLRNFGGVQTPPRYPTDVDECQFSKVRSTS